jgi:hypothetical protein
VTIRLQRLARKRWRVVRTLRDDGVAGRNVLRTIARARVAKRQRRVRYRAQAFAIDAVGNRSATVRLRVSAAAARKLRTRR